MGWLRGTSGRAAWGRRAAWGAITLCALGAPAAATADAADSLELAWHAPEDCPDGDAVRARVRGLLPGVESPPAGLWARGDVTRQGAGYLLTLELAGPLGKGERRLSAAGCEDLAAAAALVIALAIDPEAVDPAALQQLAGEPAPGTAAAADAPEPPAPAGPAPLSVAGAVRAGFVVDVGSLPAPAPGLGLGLGLRVGRLGVEAGLLYLAPIEADVDGRPAAELRMLAATTTACLELASDRLSLAPCLGVELGSLWGRGLSISDRRDGSSLWLAAGADARGGLRLGGPVWLELALGVALPLLKTVFTVENLGSVHEPAALAGRLWLGLRVEG